jgi:integrase
MMSPQLRQALESHRLNSPKSELDLVFCNKEGKPVDPDNMVKREFHQVLKRANLRKIRFHDLRHTFASLLIDQGENIKFIQMQMGHSSAKTTLDRYGHLIPSDFRDAANRLDESVFGNFVSKLLAKPTFEETRKI